jgi:hypothetical protein
MGSQSIAGIAAKFSRPWAQWIFYALILHMGFTLVAGNGGKRKTSLSSFPIKFQL